MSIPIPSWMAPDDKDSFVSLRRDIACLYVNRDEVCEDPAPASAIRYGARGFREPSWIESLPSAEDRERARLRFFIKLAAYYASEAGTLTNLSAAVGLNPRVLSTYTCRGAGRRQVSARVARAIEAACGGVVDKAQLCPEAFAD